MERAETCRLFIALPLPERVKDAIEKAQAELEQSAPDSGVRWTKRAQFHLTLKFLGDVETPRIEGLTEALRRVGGSFAALQLRAEGIGFFPEQRRPRVVWAGVQDDMNGLLKLQAALEAAVKDFTRQPAEGAFVGHITLGRCQKISRAAADALARRALAMKRNRFGDWTAEHVDLIRSELLPGGPRHTTLAGVPLAAGTAPRP